MVAPDVLSFDILSLVVSFALPGATWAILYLLAWDRRAFAESLGLGRREFWLLLPGGLLATFALLPIAPVSNDLVAISFAGAAFPLLVGTLSLRRFAPPLGRSVARLLGLLTVESAAQLVLVLPGPAAALDRWGAGVRLPSGGLVDLLVAAIAGVFSAVVWGLAARGGSTSDRRIAFLLALTSSVTVLTFLGATAIPGYGIVESFPYFLLPPAGAGIVGALVAPRVLRGEEGFALPIAFFAGGWGAVLGADLLREPPLYGHGPAGIYAIGGAGVLDLVYLSGFVALASALLVHGLFGRGWVPLGAAVDPTPPSSLGRLAAAFRHGVDGSLLPSLNASVEATRSAAEQARRLLEVPPSPAQRPWDGLSVPGWVVSDQANLESVASSGTDDLREGYRGFVTARWLVSIGRDLSLARFASLGERAVAFGIDLAVLGIPGFALFALIVLATPGNLERALSSLALNGAVYGFVALSLLYFALLEARSGRTVGKAVRGILVRDRRLGPVGGFSAIVRNVSLLPVLTLEGLGGSSAIAVLIKGTSVTGVTVAGIGLPSGLLAVLGIGVFLVGGMALFGSVGALVIALSWERQRVGDLWAGTWVLRRPTRRPVSPAGSASGPTLRVREEVRSS